MRIRGLCHVQVRPENWRMFDGLSRMRAGQSCGEGTIAGRMLLPSLPGVREGAVVLAVAAALVVALPLAAVVAADHGLARTVVVVGPSWWPRSRCYHGGGRRLRLRLSRVVECAGRLHAVARGEGVAGIRDPGSRRGPLASARRIP